MHIFHIEESGFLNEFQQNHRQNINLYHRWIQTTPQQKYCLLYRDAGTADTITRLKSFVFYKLEMRGALAMCLKLSWKSEDNEYHLSTDERPINYTRMHLNVAFLKWHFQTTVAATERFNCNHCRQHRALTTSRQIESTITNNFCQQTNAVCTYANIQMRP